MEKQFQDHNGASRLHVYGFIEQIHELMALSDCLITKPGGVTLSEAIAAELPIFIYRPVPGQEKQNVLYLESKGAAIIANEANELTEQILKLVHVIESMLSPLYLYWIKYPKQCCPPPFARIGAV
ncbi:MAG: glycosyltransferase [Bacillota bacterium]